MLCVTGIAVFIIIINLAYRINGFAEWTSFNHYTRYVNIKLRYPVKNWGIYRLRKKASLLKAVQRGGGLLYGYKLNQQYAATDIKEGMVIGLKENKKFFKYRNK
ncbi:MAG TPA: hypothetical protein VKS21_09790 [Spirochaetota bacterium]|nr:hypothetical protein [Spirochaetota bacterium]